MNYQDFLLKKSFVSVAAGFEPDLNGYRLFDFQRDIVRWSCNRGKAAVFADTGLGKTNIQLTWANEVVNKTGKPVLILAPLAVAEQTAEEARKFGMVATVVVYQNEVTDPRIYITNYEKLEHFDVSVFSGVVLDESSIIKGDGRMRKDIIATFKHTPYRLSCTATPSPNDLMEFGTQSEFLGIMSQTEMLAMFFIHDGGDTSKWRLKGHGRTKFWEWLSTWAVIIRSPRDLGYSADGYDLPELIIHDHVIDSGVTDGLLPYIAQGLSDRLTARRSTVEMRCEKAAEIANSIEGQCLIWCHLNDESDLLCNLIDGAVQVYGSQKPEMKAKHLLGFSHGEVPRLVTKPSIAGYGMNWQNCNHMVFTGLSDSFEQYYQAVRRCWRFGQTKPVHVHVISADSEGAVVANIKRKEQQHQLIGNEMVAHLKEFTLQQLGKARTEKTEYKTDVEMILPAWLFSVDKNEQWREVFDGYYAVSNCGRVKRLIAGKGARVGILAQPRDKAGYPMTSICIGGKRKAVRTHCLVAENFIGPRPDGLQVNHKDGNKANNKITNLEYVTHSENGKHAWATGLQPVRKYGEKE